jgi:hypothetical protein
MPTADNRLTGPATWFIRCLTVHVPGPLSPRHLLLHLPLHLSVTDQEDGGHQHDQQDPVRGRDTEIEAAEL